jgi:hypothetical protein
MLGLEHEQEVSVYKLALEKAEATGEMVAAFHINAAKEDLGLSKPNSPVTPPVKELANGEEAAPSARLGASDNAKANTVNLNAKSNAASKRVMAKDGSAPLKGKSGVEADKPSGDGVGFHDSKVLDNPEEDSQKTSAEETAIELQKRMLQFGKEEDIALNVLKPLLIGMYGLIDAHKCKPRRHDFMNILTKITHAIEDICGGRRACRNANS